MPDVPLTRMDLSFLSGTAGALQVTDALCATGSYTFQAEFTSQSGVVSTTSTRASCPAGARTTLSARLTSALRIRISPSSGQRVRRATLTLPSGVTCLGRPPTGAAGSVASPAPGRCCAAPAAPSRCPQSSVRGAFTVVIPRSRLAFTRAAKARQTHIVRVTTVLSNGTTQVMRAEFGG